MKLTTKHLHPTLLLIISLMVVTTVQGQETENDFQTRTNFQLSMEPLKNLEMNISPMLRFNDNLVFDQYLLEGELVYKAFKHLSVGGAYRFIGNKTKNGMENYGRYSIFSEVDKKFDRFKTAFKLNYTNYTEDDTDETYLRYKASIDYNIKNSKFKPEVGVELFQDLTNNNINRMRYSVGLDYKFLKINTIGISYKLDYYMQEFRNKHILSLSYKIKL